MEDDIIIPGDDEETGNEDASGISLPTEDKDEENYEFDLEEASETGEDEKNEEEAGDDDDDELPSAEDLEDDELPDGELEFDEDEKTEEAKDDEGSDDEEVIGTLDDLDIEGILKDIEDGNDSLDKNDESLDKLERSGADQGEIDSIRSENERLRGALSKMDDQLKKLMNEKGDLSYRVAELEAFGGDIQDPRVLIVSKNLEKAKSGDDKAKMKAVDTLKAMLDELTGDSYDGEKIDKETDMISKIEDYATNTNPNIKGNDDEDDSILTL